MSPLTAENTFVTSGPWGLFLGPFNKGIYNQPTYSQSALLNTSSWPNGISMQWTWPTASAVINASITSGSSTITINSITSGTLLIGQSISTSLTGVPSGTRLGTQLTGPALGAGTYTMQKRDSGGNIVSVNATQNNTGSVNLAPCPGICGFNQVSYGNYFGTVPQTPVTPSQINSLTQLACTHSITIGGSLSGFDAIYDLFLTSASGDSNTITNEIEIFLHTPAYSQAYINSVTQVGTYTDALGRSWQVAVDPTANQGPDYLFAPTNYADVAAATIDIKAMLQWLVVQGQIAGTLWYNGHSIGIEPASGSGRMVLNSYGCGYQNTVSPPIAGGRMLEVGDSFPGLNAIAVDANSWTTYQSGYAVMLESISQGNFLFAPSLQKGVAGRRTDEVLAAMPTDVTPNLSQFDVGVYDAGRNDVTQYPILTTQQSINNIIAGCQFFLSAGKPVVLFLPNPPRNDSTLSSDPTTRAAQRKMMVDVNNAIRTYAKGPLNGVYLVDYENLWGGQGNPPNTNFTYDGLHPSRIGAYYAANLAWTTWGALWPARTLPIYTAWNASTNNFGNLIGQKSAAAILLSGTSGQVFNATGQLATDWNFGRDSGNNPNSDIVLSKETVGDGTFRQVVTQNMTGSFTGNVLSGLTFGSAPAIPAELLNRQVVAEYTVQITSNTSMSLNSVFLRANTPAVNATSTGLSNLDGLVADAWTMPPGTYLVRSPPVLISSVAGTTAEWPALYQSVVAGTSAAYKVTKPTLNPIN